MGRVRSPFADVYHRMLALPLLGVLALHEVRELIERWANGRASLEWGPMVPPVKLGVVDGFQTSVAGFATDIPALTKWGTPYLFGPGSIHVAHRDDEFVALDELRAAPAAYAKIAREALRLHG